MEYRQKDELYLKTVNYKLENDVECFLIDFKDELRSIHKREKMNRIQWTV